MLSKKVVHRFVRRALDLAIHVVFVPLLIRHLPEVVLVARVILLDSEGAGIKPGSLHLASVRRQV